VVGAIHEFFGSAECSGKRRGGEKNLRRRNLHPPTPTSNVLSVTGALRAFARPTRILL
jgi:hypothetical protein